MSTIETLRTLMTQTETNNSFSIKSTEDVLARVTEDSFSNLYNYQRSSIPFRSYFFITYPYTDYEIGTLYLDERHRMCMTLDIDLVDQTSRENYRRSSLYQQEFTIDDICDNHDIFDKMPIVRFDDHIMADLTYSIKNGFLTIIFDRKDVFYYKDGIAHEVAVLIVPNGGYSVASTHRGLLSPSMIDNTIYFDPARFGITEFRTDGTYFATIRFINDRDPSNMYTCSIDDRGYLKVEYTSEIVSMILATSTNFNLGLIFIPELYEYRSKISNPLIPKMNNRYSGNFTLPMITIVDEDDNYLDMPIPVENMLLLRKSSGTDAAFNTYNQNAISVHYPNMYEVTGDVVGFEYKAFYFYHKANGLIHKPQYKYFYDFMKLVLEEEYSEKIINDLFYKSLSTSVDLDHRLTYYDLFEKLFLYKSPDYDYGLIDYINAPKTYPYIYKVEHLKKYIVDDSRILSRYVFDQNKLSDTYYLFVKKINLEDRIRLDTSEELVETYVFNEPMYLFIFNNPADTELNLRVWLDGLLAMKAQHFTQHNVDYIYIPTRLVNEDSYMEAELHHSFEFMEQIFLSNTSTLTSLAITNSDNEIKPTLSDITIFDAADLTKVYDMSNFEIFVTVDGLDITTENTDGTWINKYTPLSNIRIRAKTAEVAGRQLIFTIRKISEYLQKNYDRVDFPIIELVGNQENINRIQSRIFYNGRLLTDAMYSIKTDFDTNRIEFSFGVQKDDAIGIDITSYRNDPIYRAQSISLDGIVDLSSIINKPFDIRFYDVYINGRKMTEMNVGNISDTRIKIFSIHSTNLIEIYEKERDDEYYGFNKNPIDYVMKPEDLIDLPFISDEIKEEFIKQIIDKQIKDNGKEEFIIPKENDNTEPEYVVWEDEPTPELRFNRFYYNELLPKEFLNPDSPQFNKEYVAETYPEIFLDYNIHKPLVISNDIVDSDVHDVLFLDPDSSASTATTVYLLGDYQSILIL